MRLLANRWSSLTHASHCMTTSSHTDESKSKPSHVLQGILTPDAYPVAILPISGFGYWLKICWLAYPEAKQNTLRL